MAYTTDPTNIYANDPWAKDTSATGKQKSADYRAQVDRTQVAEAGRPALPAFESARNTDTGQLLDAYKLGQPNINMDALNMIRSRATGTAPSPWLNLQLQKQEADQNTAQGQALAQNANAAANARSNLAMRGGLQSGARERLAKQEVVGGNQAYQNVANTGNQNRMNLQIQDESNRQDLLKSLPQTELAYGQAAQDTNKFNIQNQLSDLLQKRAYDIGAYGQDMKAWAAGKTADAQGGGGKK